jgi:N-acetylmuramoyl-L-alanine amidase
MDNGKLIMLLKLHRPYISTVFLFFFLCSASFCEKPLLQVVIPDRDMQSYSASRLRFGGRTDPGAQVTLNGDPVRVFPNGAFAGRTTLSIGENQLLFSATSEIGSSSVVRSIRRNEPLQTTSREILTIEKAMMEPDQHLNLLPGDLFTVRFKGTPGGRASFSIGNSNVQHSMIAAPPENHGGIDGIYISAYKIQPGDRFEKAPIRYSLTTPGFGTTSRVSSARLQVNPDNWPRVGITTGNSIELSAGLGSGRLGGADLGRLTEGVQLELTAQVDNMYRVQLSPSHTAWINTRNITLLPRETPPPRSLVNTATVSPGKRADTLRIPLDVRLPYLLSISANPPALTLHLYGATSNLTWMQENPDVRDIRRTRWTQAEDNQLRFELELAQSPLWGVSANYDDNDLVLSVRNRPPLSAAGSPPLEGLRVGLDPGHGGSNRGALGNLGALEKDVMQSLGQKVQEALEQAGANVILVRKDDEYVEQAERFNRALKGDADLFLSLHANSIALSGDPIQVKGTSVYYRHDFNRDMAETVYRRLLELGLRPFGLVGSFNATVVKFTDIPSILVETAFLSHPEEEAMLLDEQEQERIAKAITDGLEDFFRQFQQGHN